MTQRLHPRTVGQLPARVRPDGTLTRAEYFDAEEQGLSVRVTPAGERSYYYTYSRLGVTRRVRLGDVGTVSLAEAREQVRTLRARIQLERADPAGERAAERRASRPEVLTVQGLGERCLGALELRPSTRATWTRLLARELTPVAARPAGELMRREVRDLLEAIVARGARVQANRVFELMRRIYTWGVAQDLVSGSPCAGLTAPTRRTSRERVLTTDELRALVRALDATPAGAMVDAVWTLLLTGVRRANVLTCDARELLDLEGDAARWAIGSARMKAARPHVVPLSSAAVAILRRRAEQALAAGHALLWPARGVTPPRPATWPTRWRHSLRAAVEVQAGGPVPAWTVHDLRRTVATHLRETLRVPRDVVALLLAHGRRDSTAIYDRAELLAERRAALVAWAAYLDRLRAAGSQANVLPMSRPDPGEGQGRAESSSMMLNSEESGDTSSARPNRRSAGVS